MDHVAIMKKSWGLTEKILSGEKKIESRWYKVRRKPWGAIQSGDAVYFKNSGEPVTIRTRVKDVIQISELTPGSVKDTLRKYGEDDGIETGRVGEFYERFKDKNYCILVFLENPTKIQPFEIDKKGFGVMAAWISVDDIKRIRK